MLRSPNTLPWWLAAHRRSLMHGKRRWLGILKLALVGAACLFFSTLSPQRFRSATTPTVYYVLGGGAGTCSGADWANAAGKIPAALNPGDVVYIGNSGVNLGDATTTPCAGETRHKFTTSGTSVSPITIKAATTADHGTATGWNSAYAVDVTPAITWSNSNTPADGSINPFWDFCGSFYNVTGQVGSADQTGTYGFYFKSAAAMFGFIRADSHACSEATLTNLNFQYVELDGINPNATYNATHAGADGFYLGSPVSTTAYVGPVLIDHSYVHDIFGPIISAGRTLGMTVTNSYLERNFSDSKWHSNAISTASSNNDSSQIGIQNLDVHDDVFQNIQGTGVVVCLDGVCDGWKVYNNVFYYTSDWDSLCEYGDTTASCGVSKSFGDNQPGGVVTNSVFYGNTLASIHIKPGQPGADNAGVVIQLATSTGNIAENNLWYDCTIGGAIADGTGTGNNDVSHDYNTLINTGYATTLMSIAANESQQGASGGTISGGAADPLVNSNVSTSTFTSADFRLSSETADAHLNDGVSLAAPYSSDFTGAKRGVDGTWERGAYEFNAGTVAQKSGPPLNLTVTSVQ
jgi:hypothetical protein